MFVSGNSRGGSSQRGTLDVRKTEYVRVKYKSGVVMLELPSVAEKAVARGAAELVDLSGESIPQK